MSEFRMRFFQDQPALLLTGKNEIKIAVSALGVIFRFQDAVERVFGGVLDEYHF